MTGSTNYLIPNGTNIQTQTGNTYFITNISANFILPAIANIGDTISIILPNMNGGNFNIIQNPGQRIVSWNTINPNNPVVLSGDGNRLLVNGGQGFFLTTNFAASWVVEPPLEPWTTPNQYKIIQVSADGSHIFGIAIFNNYYGILTSTDYGNSWNLNTNISFNGYSLTGIACSTNGATAVAVVNQGGVFTSADAGSNWTLQTSAPTSAYWTSIASSADGTKLVASAQWNGNIGGIYISTNSGSNWILQISAPTNAGWASVASSADGSKLVAVQSYGSIYTSSNYGQTWILETNSPNNIQWNSVASSADGTKLIAAAWYNAGYIYSSLNSGQTWNLKTNGLPSILNYVGITSSADGTKLATSGNGQIFTSGDSGNTWNLCSTFQSQYSIMVGQTSFGTTGGATFNSLDNGLLNLVYIGNGMFAITDPYNQGNLNGY